MRLVRRLTLYLLIPIGLVFALDTFLTLRSDLSMLDADMHRDDTVLARDLAVAVEQSWRNLGERTAFDLVSRFKATDAGIEARIVYLDDEAGTAGAPAVPELVANLSREASPIQARARRGDALWLFTYFHLDLPGSRRTALEVSEIVSHEREHLAARIPRKVFTAGVMLLLCAGVAWVVGVRVVGRPVDTLIDKAHRIGRGDFSTPLDLAGRDELSGLAREMNAMAEMLEVSRRQLEAESAARIAAVEQLRHADRLTTVGRLASGLAHELGTPLNIVSGRAQMIASGESAAPAEVARAARVIGEQAHRMTLIVRQLLDFARQSGAKRAETDLRKLAADTVGFVQPLGAARGVRVIGEESGEPVVASVDSAQIQQALANLVMNAIQASPKGSEVRVRVRTRDFTEAPRAAHPPGRHAILEVEDHGEGIPADHLPSIFDPFFTTKPVGEGTGLGLAMVYGILEEHGGWVEVQSEPGRGSCFTAFIPTGVTRGA